MKDTFSALQIAFAAIGISALGANLWAQCSIGNCQLIDYFNEDTLPSCWASASCSTDPSFFDPCGSSWVVVNCNGGDGAGACSTGSGSMNGNGHVSCSRAEWNEQSMSYETVISVKAGCCSI